MEIAPELLHQLATQHDPLRQMWLSGYLYALAERGQAAAPPAAVNAPTRAKLTLLFGSQTGNSKKAAQRILAELQAKGHDGVLADMNDYPTAQLGSERLLVVVVSTQGEGEPPVAAESFYQWLHSARAPRLPELRFAVCGLGDRSYLHFCKTGKDFDARLEQLGAHRLIDRVDCDVDFEHAATAFAQALLQALDAVTPVAASPNGSVKSEVQTLPAQATYNRKNPFEAPILEKIQLNGQGSTKETWHIECSLAGSGLRYEPGDALGVYPENSPEVVREVLYAAMLNGQKIVQWEGREGYLKDFLAKEIELSVLTREVLERYAAWTQSGPLQKILQDPAALKTFLWGRQVADLLREYPAALSEQSLLGILRKMPPRLYSIASSLSAHPEEVHLTVAAVRYQWDGRPHAGVASTFLADRVRTGEAVKVFVEHNEYFKLPSDHNTDIIMIGPGTGVAPFRAFVAERTERGAKGRNWLFFGNPHFETDFLYQTEWLNHLKRGTLDRLDVAFSRDQTEKIYVQHRILEKSRLLFERLENGAHCYVCGDKTRMAPDVQAAFLQLIEKESGKGREYAAEYLKKLKQQRRYLEDVY